MPNLFPMMVIAPVPPSCRSVRWEFAVGLVTAEEQRGYLQPVSLAPMVLPGAIPGEDLRWGRRSSPLLEQSVASWRPVVEVLRAQGLERPAVR